MSKKIILLFIFILALSVNTFAKRACKEERDLWKDTYKEEKQKCKELDRSQRRQCRKDAKAQTNHLREAYKECKKAARAARKQERKENKCEKLLATIPSNKKNDFDCSSIDREGLKQLKQLRTCNRVLERYKRKFGNSDKLHIDNFYVNGQCDKKAFRDFRRSMRGKQISKRLTSRCQKFLPLLPSSKQKMFTCEGITKNKYKKLKEMAKCQKFINRYKKRYGEDNKLVLDNVFRNGECDKSALRTMKQSLKAKRKLSKYKDKCESILKFFKSRHIQSYFVCNDEINKDYLRTMVKAIKCDRRIQKKEWFSWNNETKKCEKDKAKKKEIKAIAKAARRMTRKKARECKQFLRTETRGMKKGYVPVEVMKSLARMKCIVLSKVK